MGENFFSIKKTQDNGVGLRAQSKRIEFGKKHCLRFLFLGVIYISNAELNSSKGRNVISFRTFNHQRNLQFQLRNSILRQAQVSFQTFFIALFFLLVLYNCIMNATRIPEYISRIALRYSVK